jgi:hypothetical protein
VPRPDARGAARLRGLSTRSARESRVARLGAARRGAARLMPCPLERPKAVGTLPSGRPDAGPSAASLAGDLTTGQAYHPHPRMLPRPSRRRGQAGSGRLQRAGSAQREATRASCVCATPELSCPTVARAAGRFRSATTLRGPCSRMFCSPGCSPAVIAVRLSLLSCIDMTVIEGRLPAMQEVTEREPRCYRTHSDLPTCALACPRRASAHTRETRKPPRGGRSNSLP